jgi:monoamine oxidase
MIEERYSSETPGPGWVSAGESRWLRSVQEPQREGTPRIAVIGGGPGGLFTSYILNCRLPEAAITIFEGSGRLGGKIRTDSFSDGTYFEAGVAELYEYLGPGGRDPLRILIEDECQLKTVNMSGGGVVLKDKALPDLDALQREFGLEVRDCVERFHKRMSELMPLERYANRWQPDNKHPWANKTFWECLHEEIPDCCDARCYICAAVHSDLATEPWTCNGLNGIKNVLMDNDKYMQLYHVIGGIERFPQALAGKIAADFRLEHRVCGIGKVGDKYRVSFKSDAADSSADFDCVIVCLPNHWLSQIRWQGDKLQQAIHDLCAHYDLPAHYLRVSMNFRRPWWHYMGMPGDFWMNDYLGGCCTYDESTRWRSTRGHVISWLLAGNDAMLMVSHNQSEEWIVRYVLDSLPAEQAKRAAQEFVEAQVDRYVGSLNALPGGFPAAELEGEHQLEPEDHPGIFMVGDFFFDSTLNGALMSANTATRLLINHIGAPEVVLPEFINQLEPDGPTL